MMTVASKDFSFILFPVVSLNGVGGIILVFTSLQVSIKHVDKMIFFVNEGFSTQVSASTSTRNTDQDKWKETST